VLCVNDGDGAGEGLCVNDGDGAGEGEGNEGAGVAQEPPLEL
jgi:hypothetical protein